MKASPLRSLLSQQVCQCNRSIVRSTIRRPQSTPSRFISSTSKKSDGPFTGSYGSSELLKRRHQGLNRSTLPGGERAKAIRRMKISALGIVVCSACIFYTISFAPDPKAKSNAPQHTRDSRITRYDAGPASLPGTASDLEDEKGEQVATGTSTIPTFPKIIHLSTLSPPANAGVTDTGTQEYQLIGLGIRTVSFLGIQVYVVGLYVAMPDIATLQERLIRNVDSVATTLVPQERQKLKDMLLDPEKGEEVWNKILKDVGIRTVFRIVPTRNTDFMHLRDGWVRGITARAQQFSSMGDASYNEETFGNAMNDFKAIWGGGARKSLPKGEILLMTRDAQGHLGAWYEDMKGASIRLGGLNDERISRLIWLGYLGGKTVSSEGARKSVVDGCMDLVERPVGTIATQVI